MSHHASPPLGRLWRWGFIVFWFLMVPGAAAALFLTWCENPGRWFPEGAAALSSRRASIALLIFSLCEVTLYRRRFALPPRSLGVHEAERHLSPRQRWYQAEAISYLNENASAVERKRARLLRRLGAQRLRAVEEAIQELVALAEAVPFDPQALDRKLAERANDLQSIKPFRKSSIREYLESIVIALLLLATMRVFAFEPFHIPSGSMLPTLQIGDYIFSSKLPYGPILPFTDVRLGGHLPPSRSDVIVFNHREGGEGTEMQALVKRVIGLPGDVIEVAGGHPTVNGWQVPHCWAGEYRYAPGEGRTGEQADVYVEFLGERAYLTLYAREAPGSAMVHRFTVQPGELYVLGDNRLDSHDSRYWNRGQGGGVALGEITGRAVRVWLPLSRWMVSPVDPTPFLPADLSASLRAGVQRCLLIGTSSSTPPDHPPFQPPPP